jgi:O-antigen/teichoic acid export membrane protein
MSHEPAASTVPPGPTQNATNRAALVNVGLKVAGTLLAFAVNVLLARNLVPEEFAAVVVALTWLALATALGSLSTPLLLVRFVGKGLSEGRPDLARGVVRWSYLMVAAASLLLAALAAAVLASGLAPVSLRDSALAMLAIALILPNAMITAVAGLLQSLRRTLTAEFVNGCLRSALLLLVLGCVLLWPHGQGLSARVVLEVYLGVSVLLLLLAGGLASRAQQKTVPAASPAYATGEWTKAGAGMLAVLVAAAANERIDLLMLGWRAEGSEVATYAVAQRFAQMLLFTSNAVGAVMAPHFVAQLPAVRRGDLALAQQLVRSTAMLTLWLCLAAWLCFLLAGPWLTGIFGPHYAGATMPLMILVSGQVLAALFGPGTLVAILAGYSRLALVTLLFAMSVNALLNVLLVPWLGASGAALATAAGMVLSAVLARAWLRRRLGMDIGLLARPGARAHQTVAP